MVFLILSGSHSAVAHPYASLIPGTSLSYSYSFRVETDRKEFKQADTDGFIRAVSVGWEEKNSKRYLKMVTSYEGIPFMKEDSTVWRREDEKGIYVAQERKPGVLFETIELPVDLRPGVEWSYDDGAKSIRKVERTLEFVLPDGERLTDCIEVTRRVPANPAWKDLTIYCRGIGAVKILFLQTTPVGLYRTETSLTSYKGTEAERVDLPK